MFEVLNDTRLNVTLMTVLRCTTCALLFPGFKKTDGRVFRPTCCTGKRAQSAALDDLFVSGRVSFIDGRHLTFTRAFKIYRQYRRGWVEG